MEGAFANSYIEITDALAGIKTLLPRPQARGTQAILKSGGRSG